MSMVLRYAARSDVGMVRTKNDDSAYAGRYLAVVADGMGGHAGGNVASASTVLDLVHLDRPEQDGQPLTVLADEIQAANSLLSELVTTSPQLSGMGTTVTALLLHGNSFAFAHIGDSRAYRLRDGVFEQISIDHTFVQRLIDEGRLRPEEAEIHPHKNVLMRVLGDVDASPELDLATFDVVPGEKWLLCSDGLTAVLREEEIEAVVRSTPDLQECCDTLVELTLAGGSPDNVTVAVIEPVPESEAEAAAVAAAYPSPAADASAPDGARAAGPAAAREAASGDLDRQPAGGARTAAEDDSDEPRSEAPGPDDDSPEDDAAAEAARVALIRQDLQSRPHVLVGAAALATETGQIPIVARQSADRRAARMLMHKPESETEQEPEAPRRRRPRWLIPAILTVLAVLLAGVLWVGYAWTQTRYYVGSQDNRVAIFNGVSQTIGPIKLSHVSEVSDITVDSLPEYSRDRVERTLPARDLEHAEQIVEELRGTARAALACPPAEGGAEENRAEASAPASGSPTEGSEGGEAQPSPQAGAADQCEGQQ